MAWGVPVWAKLPTPSLLTSHAWGREGKQSRQDMPMG